MSLKSRNAFRAANRAAVQAVEQADAKQEEPKQPTKKS